MRDLDLSHYGLVNQFTVDQVALLYAELDPALQDINVAIQTHPKVRITREALMSAIEADEIKPILRYQRRPFSHLSMAKINADAQADFNLAVYQQASLESYLIPLLVREDLKKWFESRDQYPAFLFGKMACQLDDTKKLLPSPNKKTDSHNNGELIGKAKSNYNRFIGILLKMIMTSAKGNKFSDKYGFNVSAMRDAIMQFCEDNSHSLVGMSQANLDLRIRECLNFIEEEQEKEAA